MFFMVVVALLVAIKCQCLRNKGDAAMSISPFDYYLFGEPDTNPGQQM